MVNTPLGLNTGRESLSDIERPNKAPRISEDENLQTSNDQNTEVSENPTLFEYQESQIYDDQNTEVFDGEYLEVFYLHSHTQTSDSQPAHIDYNFSFYDMEKDVFLFQNIIIDFNNQLNRADIAINKYEDRELVKECLKDIEPINDLYEEGYILIDKIFADPTVQVGVISAAEHIKELMDIIGKVI